MSKHNRQDPIFLQPNNIKRQRLNNNSKNRADQSTQISALQSPSKPRYSAADLLNPKARSSNSAATSKTDGKLQDGGNDGSRAGNMLLNLHGVSSRIAPLKSFGRSTLAEKSDNAAADGQRKGFMSSGRGSSGLLSLPKVDEKEDSQRHPIGSATNVQIDPTDFEMARPGSSRPVIDLTNNDDDDEIIYNGTVSLEPIICYGMIPKVQASIHCIPDPPPNIDLAKFGTMWPTIPVHLQRGDARSYVVHVITSSGKNVGTLRGSNARGIATLMDLSLAKFQACFVPRFRGYEVAGHSTSQSAEMTINLYGTEKNAKKVGHLLRQQNCFLMDPIRADPNVPYKNPQYPSEDTTNGSSAMNAIDRARLGKATFSVRTTEEVKHEITAVLDSLEKVQVLEETEGDPRIMTPLLPHQKQGLSFMIKKEGEQTYDGDDDTSFWKLKISPGGVKIYHNVITGQDTRTKPPDCFGGILADDMGLGKTLTVLSLIVSTLDKASTFGKKKKNGASTENDLSTMFAKTTLLICPLSVLVNWEDQIKTHVSPDTLSLYVYHGNHRSKNLKELAKYDLVLTTYALAASDFGKAQKRDNGSVLQKIHWFRIVLDEAHTIREQNTVQSKAICNLEASRRWAVTGTPVQNRLDDLGTLIKFLRLSPFEARSEFNQFISAPLKSGDPTSMDKLRILVDSIALRRRKDKIDLPPKHDTTVSLEFSKPEQELYTATARQSRYKMDMVTRQGHLSGKAYVTVLQTILRLRLICASTDLVGPEDTAGFIASNAIDIDSLADEEYGMGRKQAFEIYNLMKETDEDICYTCQKKVNTAAIKEGTPPADSERMNIPFGHITSCPHLFCTDCGPKYLNTLLEHASLGDWVKCPLCNQDLRVGIRDLKMADDPALQNETGKRKVVYRNPSTKIMKLVEDMLDNRERGDDKGRIKSVIFSGWTMHLDLIEAAFDNAGITHTRIDGKMNRSQRSEALGKFRDDPDVEAILVSIAAGGVGLNLTAASMVYVMEPQFNPAAEAQAIDRIHRLGQEREVFCTRYIMKDSFEEKIVQLQKKKQKIADLSMTQGKSKKQRAQDKIDDLKELFK